MENVETNLAKSLVTNSSEYGAQNLVNVWRESNLAQSTIDNIPINVYELESANKLLNQILHLLIRLRFHVLAKNPFRLVEFVTTQLINFRLHYHLFDRALQNIS